MIAGLLAFAACAYTDYRLWPLDMPDSARPRIPATTVQAGRIAVPFTLGVPAAEVAHFNDQLEAFLRFEYLRGRVARDGHDASRILLTAVDTHKKPSYRIFIVTDNDLLTAEPELAQLEGRKLIAHYEFQTWSPKEYSYFQQESHTFDVSYDVPANQKLEAINTSYLLPALAEFLVFKSQTDNRIMGGSDDAPRPLTREQATQLATDILDVAHFYDLPLDYFLGVGAMENDYMDVDGDLTHAVWKKRAERGDVILRRNRKRVMVSDYAIGTWQITRETLRAAHELYLHDKRDYSKLPPRLRPSRSLNLNLVSDAQMTTYAGLLLRDLLDHFGGNVDKAIGAYNGGVRTPNPDYANGVKTVADYARRILEHAPTLDDRGAGPAPNPANPSKPQPSAPAACPPPASSASSPAGSAAAPNPAAAPNSGSAPAPNAASPSNSASAPNPAGCVASTDPALPSSPPKPPYRRDD